MQQFQSYSDLCASDKTRKDRCRGASTISQMIDSTNVASAAARRDSPDVRVDLLDIPGQVRVETRESP